jgi:hypothetical protein
VGEHPVIVSEKLRKLAALLNDPASTEGEKAACRAAIERLKRSANHDERAQEDFGALFANVISDQGMSKSQAFELFERAWEQVRTVCSQPVRNPGYPDAYKE